MRLTCFEDAGRAGSAGAVAPWQDGSSVKIAQDRLAEMRAELGRVAVVDQMDEARTASGLRMSPAGERLLPGGPSPM